MVVFLDETFMDEKNTSKIEKIPQKFLQFCIRELERAVQPSWTGQLKARKSNILHTSIQNSQNPKSRNPKVTLQKSKYNFF